MGEQEHSSPEGGDRHFAVHALERAHPARAPHPRRGRAARAARAVRLGAHGRLSRRPHKLDLLRRGDGSVRAPPPSSPGEQQIARRVGEETIAQHAGTPVATLMRSLGSPEAIYDADHPGGQQVHHRVGARGARGGARARRDPRVAAARASCAPVQHCDWAKGLLSQPTALFGLPPATVEESACQARGDEACVYEITWDAEPRRQDRRTRPST